LLNYCLIIIEGAKNNLKLCDRWEMKQKKHKRAIKTQSPSEKSCQKID